MRSLWAIIGVTKAYRLLNSTFGDKTFTHECISEGSCSFGRCAIHHKGSGLPLLRAQQCGQHKGNEKFNIQKVTAMGTVV